MTPRELAIYLSGALGFAAYAGLNIDRALLEAGVRTSFGRGASARRATADDAVALLIAMAGAPIYGSAVGQAVDTFEKYALLPFRDSGLARPIVDSPFPLLAALPADHAFGTALATVIDSLTHGDIPQSHHVVVELSSPWPAAELAIYGDRAFGGDYRAPLPGDDKSAVTIDAERHARDFGTGLIVRRRIGDRHLRDIAAAIGG